MWQTHAVGFAIMTPSHQPKRISVFVVALFAIAGLCPVSAAGRAEPEIPPDLDTYAGLQSALESENEILLYDVRSAAEVESGRIPGAVNIAHTEIAAELPRSYRNRVIVVYCASGGRSRAAFDALVDKGFKYVFDFGGIANWEGELTQE